MSESIHQNIRNVFYTRYLETLPFIIDNEYSSVVQILGYSKQDEMDKRVIQQAVYELGDVKDHVLITTNVAPNKNCYNFPTFQGTQEFSSHCIVSSSDDESKCKKWRIYEEACEVMLIEKDYVRALQLFDKYLMEVDDGTSASKDLPTLQWMEQCKKNILGSSTCTDTTIQ